ncbi:MAG: hypothetical protein ACHQU1_07160 [Gemmatimonadales bacterium]
MMPILTLLLVGFVSQQPQSTTPRRAAPATPGSATSPAQRQRTPAQAAAMDTTMRVVADVALIVADVKAETDRFRTRAFNDPTGSVLESAAAFRAACERLAAAARAAPPKMCRTCLRPQSQPAFNHYRAFLPTLAGLGGRCAARLRTKVTADASQAVLRQTAIDMSNMMIAGLRPYEARIGEIRATLTPTNSRAAPRPGGR